MGNKLQFLVELQDRLTTPLRAVQRAIGGINNSLRGVSKSSVQALGGLADRLRATLPPAKLLPAALKGVERVSGGFVGLGRSITGTMGLVGGLANSLINLPTLLTAGAAGAIGAFALNSAAFKENTLAGFQTLTRSAETGNRMFRDAIKFAAETPFGTQQIIQASRQLLGGQFSQQEIPILLRAVGDVGALGGFSDDIMRRAITAVSQIHGGTTLMQQDLNQLKDAGVPLGAVYEAMGKKIGKTAAEVKKLQEQGKISSNLGIYGVLAGIQNTISGGKLGKFTEDQSKTLTGLFSTLKSKPFEFLMDIDTSKGFQAVKDTIDRANKLLDSSFGQKIKSRIHSLFSGVFNAIFAPLSANLNEASIMGIFDRLQGYADAIKRSWPGVKKTIIDVWDGIKAAVSSAIGVFDKIAGAITPVTDFITKNWPAFANKDTPKTIGSIAGAVLAVWAAMKLLNIATFGALGSLGKMAAIKGFPMLLSGIKAIITDFKTLSRSINVASITRSFAMIRSAVLLTGITISRFAVNAFRSLVRLGGAWLIAMGPVGWIIAGVMALGAAFIWLWNKFPGFRKAVLAVWDGVKTGFTKAWEFLAGLPARLGKIFVGVWDTIKGVFSNIGQVFADIFDKLPGWAKSIISGLSGGLIRGTPQIEASTAGVGGKAALALEKRLGIQSPSKVFEGIGRFMSLGLSKGIVASSAAVTASMAAIVPGSPSQYPVPSYSIGENIGTRQANPNSGSINFGGVTINISGDYGVQDGEKLAENIMRELYRLASEAGKI